MVTVQEVGRSLRGAAALVSRRPDALAAFDVTSRGLAQSVTAFVMTIPAFVVAVALERRGMGLPVHGLAIFDHVPLLAQVGLAHLGSLAALQLAMMYVLRGGGLTTRYVPFAVATNWIAVFGSLALALPAALFPMGLEPQGLVALLMIAFGAIVIEAQWFATKMTLGVRAGTAATIVLLGLSLQIVIYGLLRGFAA